MLEGMLPVVLALSVTMDSRMTGWGRENGPLRKLRATYSSLARASITAFGLPVGYHHGKRNAVWRGVRTGIGNAAKGSASGIAPPKVIAGMQTMMV